MDKEIKISELAKIWNVSVNATWTRIKREGLITVKKLDNNREITFVNIPEDVLNKYMVNNGVNNGNYEELLTDDNTSSSVKTPSSQEILEKMIDFSNEVQERLITLNENHNKELMNLTEEVNNYRSKIPLLEDKASREGLYLKEIKDLKKNNKNLIIFIIISVAIIVAMAFLLMFQHFNPQTVTEEKQVTKIITVDANGKPISILTEKNPAGQAR